MDNDSLSDSDYSSSSINTNSSDDGDGAGPPNPHYVQLREVLRLLWLLIVRWQNHTSIEAKQKALCTELGYLFVKRQLWARSDLLMNLVMNLADELGSIDNYNSVGEAAFSMRDAAQIHLSSHLIRFLDEYDV